MEVGKRYNSFADFDKHFKEFCLKTNSVFVKRSSTKVKDERLLTLLYESLILTCKHSKAKHAAQSSGQRPCQKSLKLGCTAKLTLKLKRPKDGPPHLAIESCDLTHTGHVATKEAVQLLPERRKIALNDATKLLASSSTIKTSELRSMLEAEHAVSLLPHDVYNLKKKLHQTGSDIDECESVLREIESEGGCVCVGKSDSELQYLFYMSYSMKNMLTKYPEVILFDCTYKTNRYLYPLLTAMVIDGEGHGIPVMHCYLQKEDRVSMEHCLRVFAQQFNFTQTHCFVVDKDLSEIAALGSVFPDVPVNLCAFHVQQAVKRYLKKELPSDSVDIVLDMFMSMVYTESEAEFGEILSSISNIVPQSVTNYFATNWWQKSSLWACHKNVSIMKLHASTTNHLESYHSKIKKIVSEKISLAVSLRQLLSFDDSKIADSRRRLVIQANCVTYDHRDSDETLRAISLSLSRFAADIVKSELSCARRICYEISSLHDSVFSVSYRERSHQTTTESCSCSSFQHMTLACRHIFALRIHLNSIIFDNTLVPFRFSRTLSSDSVSSTGEATVVDIPLPNLSYRTQEGRFRKSKAVCDFLASHLSVLGVEEFVDKIDHLESLIQLWTVASPVPMSNSVVSLPNPAASSGPSLDSFRGPVASSEQSLDSFPDPVASSGPSLDSFRGPVASSEQSFDSFPDPVASSEQPLDSFPDPVASSGPSLDSFRGPVASSEQSLDSFPDPVASSEPSLDSVPDPVASSEPSLDSFPDRAPSTAPLASGIPSSPVTLLSDVNLGRLVKPWGCPRNVQKFTLSKQLFAGNYNKNGSKYPRCIL